MLHLEVFAPDDQQVAGPQVETKRQSVNSQILYEHPRNPFLSFFFLLIAIVS